ncbi:MAG: ATP-dependent Clp protease proteolytic subunit [Acetobacteraceae bacterium]|nr:ATP-dependent Clp protease proteolytic subunit [Acetobacteraceae bacterium]
MSLFDLFWLVLILWSLVPVVQRRALAAGRVRAIRQIQAKRGSRVITMIHRQEALSFLGIPFNRFIDIEDSEEVLRAIRLTPPDVPIDLVLHTPGGLVLAVEQIAHAIRSHRGKVTVFVPHYAMSGGTLLALAADEIVMDENAVLGPVDPQLGNFPAVSVLKAVEQKTREKAEDRTLILADVAEKAINQVYDLVFHLVKDRMEPDRARELAEALSKGRWTHDYPITCEQLRAMGLNVICGLPQEIYTLMRYYPQPAGRRPSVQYVPLPSEGRSPRDV